MLLKKESITELRLNLGIGDKFFEAVINGEELKDICEITIHGQIGELWTVETKRQTGSADVDIDTKQYNEFCNLKPHEIDTKEFIKKIKKVGNLK